MRGEFDRRMDRVAAAALQREADRPGRDLPGVAMRDFLPRRIVAQHLLAAGLEAQPLALDARVLDGEPPGLVGSRAVQRVAEAVVYMASLPPDTNIQFMTVMATKMPFVGRG